MTTKPAVRVTVLVENTAGGGGLLGEHGMAFWIEAGPKRVLFDTGQGAVFEHNARRLKIPLASADAIVLSHGHCDHKGGLARAVEIAPQARVFAHPAAFHGKYARGRDGTAHDAGTRLPDENEIRKNTGGLVWTNKPTEICDGLFVTGEIPRVTEFEDTGGPFFLDEQCRQADPLIDDQAMFFEADAGTVVLLGCAHAGVINTLVYIRQLTDDRPVHAVIGGMHLVNASPGRMDRTTESLERFGIDLLAPCHCTGMAALVRLRTAFPDSCKSCIVGTTMEFEKP